MFATVCWQLWVRFLRDTKNKWEFWCVIPIFLNHRSPQSVHSWRLGAGLCLKSRSVLNLISHRDGIQSEIKRHCWTLVKQEYFFSGINNADRHYEIYSMTQWQIETRKIVSSLSSVKHEPLRLKCPAQQSWGKTSTPHLHHALNSRSKLDPLQINANYIFHECCVEVSLKQYVQFLNMKEVVRVPQFECLRFMKTSFHYFGNKWYAMTVGPWGSVRLTQETPGICWQCRRFQVFMFFLS